MTKLLRVLRTSRMSFADDDGELDLIDETDERMG